MGTPASARVMIRGRVQGVWFRAWTAGEAQRLALDGWVRNRVDGSVEAVFQGPEAAVREMVELCRIGPPAARVDQVEELPAETLVAAGFMQKPTI
jgi:acylphosphatase